MQKNMNKRKVKGKKEIYESNRNFKKIANCV